MTSGIKIETNRFETTWGQAPKDSHVATWVFEFEGGQTLTVYGTYEEGCEQAQEIATQIGSWKIWLMT